MFGVALALFLMGAFILAADMLIRFNDELRQLDKTSGAYEAIERMIKANALGIAGRFLIFISLFLALVRLISMHYS